MSTIITPPNNNPSSDYPRPVRSEFVRAILKTLTDKYHVHIPGIAKDLSKRPQMLHDFLAYRRKSLSQKNLDQLEYYLFDLYGGILEYEIPKDSEQFQAYMEQFISDSPESHS